MPPEDFHQQARTDWDSAIASVSGSSAGSTIVWRGAADITAALDPFMGANRNHAHLPTGGGQDFKAVLSSSEPGCLEFRVGSKGGYVVKPKSLILERISAPGNSFLLLELDELEPSGIYDVGPDEDEDYEVRNRAHRARGSEELVELQPGQYEDRSLWDRGFLGYDESGRERPLPEDARIVVRFFQGKILFVSKGSLWNGTPRTYDGVHDKMTAAQIRQTIEKALDHRSKE